MPDRKNTKLSREELNAARDWYIQRLKSQMGVGSADGLANPDGSTDNYRGYKPDVELAMTRDLDETGNIGANQSSYDANLDPELYRKDPAAWEKKAREGIKSWTIGGDDNQQYVYDPNSGEFVRQWHKDTSDRKAIQDAMVAAAAMYGIHGLGEYLTAAELAGAGAEAGAGEILGAAGDEAAQTVATETAKKAAADGASKAWTIKDVTQAARVLQNPLGAAASTVLGNLSPEMKDYLDLISVVTGKNPIADVARKINSGGKSGATQNPPPTGGKSGATQNPPPTGGKSGATQNPPPTGGEQSEGDAYGIPLGLLAMLGAQQPQQRPQIDPTYRPDTAALKFDPFR